MKKKLIRITTVPISLEKLLAGQLRFMKLHYDVIAVSSDEEGLQRVGALEQVPVFVVELTRAITPLKDLKATFRLYQFFKKEKPFIVHTHTPKAGTLGMIAAKLSGVPCRLHTVAGLPLLEENGNKRKLLNFVEKITYACATQVYPNSFGLKEIIVKEGFCKTRKLKVIAAGSTNGIDTNHFCRYHVSQKQKVTLRVQLGINLDDFVFIFVGRLVGDKGIRELVSAFHRLSEITKHVKLLLVGSEEPELDPLSPETEELIANNSDIISVGYQADVRPYFAISHALLFPSYREGFPNVVMQAGAMELPSVVTNINGCNEIIHDKINGLVVPVKDSHALYIAIKELFENQTLYNDLKVAARPMITSRYEQQHVWNELLKEYEHVENQYLTNKIEND